MCCDPNEKKRRAERRRKRQEQMAHEQQVEEMWAWARRAVMVVSTAGMGYIAYHVYFLLQY
jgi:hypothetical protein